MFDPDPTAALRVSFVDISACGRDVLTAKRDSYENQCNPKVSGSWAREVQEVRPPIPTPAKTETATTAVEADPLGMKAACSLSHPPDRNS